MWRGYLPCSDDSFSLWRAFLATIKVKVNCWRRAYQLPSIECTVSFTTPQDLKGTVYPYTVNIWIIVFAVPTDRNCRKLWDVMLVTSRLNPSQTSILINNYYDLKHRLNNMTKNQNSRIKSYLHWYCDSDIERLMPLANNHHYLTWTLWEVLIRKK